MITPAWLSSTDKKSWIQGGRPTGKFTLHMEFTFVSCRRQLTKSFAVLYRWKEWQPGFPMSIDANRHKDLPRDIQFDSEKGVDFVLNYSKAYVFPPASVKLEQIYSSCEDSWCLWTAWVSGMLTCEVFFNAKPSWYYDQMLSSSYNVPLFSCQDYLEKQNHYCVFITRDICIEHSCRCMSLHWITIAQNRSKQNCLHHALILKRSKNGKNDKILKMIIIWEVVVIGSESCRTENSAFLLTKTVEIHLHLMLLAQYIQCSITIFHNSF